MPDWQFQYRYVIAAAGACAFLPFPVLAADAAAEKPIVLESGLAYIQKKKNEGLLSNVEQQVGPVS